MRHVLLFHESLSNEVLKGILNGVGMHPFQGRMRPKDMKWNGVVASFNAVGMEVRVLPRIDIYGRKPQEVGGDKSWVIRASVACLRSVTYQTFESHVTYETFATWQHQAICT